MDYFREAVYFLSQCKQLEDRAITLWESCNLRQVNIPVRTFYLQFYNFKINKYVDQWQNY